MRLRLGYLIFPVALICLVISLPAQAQSAEKKDSPQRIASARSGAELATFLAPRDIGNSGGRTARVSPRKRNPKAELICGCMYPYVCVVNSCQYSSGHYCWTWKDDGFFGCVCGQVTFC